MPKLNEVPIKSIKMRRGILDFLSKNEMSARQVYAELKPNMTFYALQYHLDILTSTKNLKQTKSIAGGFIYKTINKDYMADVEVFDSDVPMKETTPSAIQEKPLSFAMLGMQL